MRELSLKLVTKKGESKELALIIPETIPEMVNVLGAKFVLDTVTREYIRREKRRFISGWKPREKILKIRAKDLSVEQTRALIKLGLMTE